MPTIFRFGGYRKPTPSLFGDGSDGDFYLAAGETHIEAVTVPHQSVVEKNYKSLTIEAGALYRCSDCNAGLVIRVKGDCTIHGTIDQSGKAPKTNLNNNYPYPEELVCGDGGDGGKGEYNTGMSTNTYVSGGPGMSARKYGGGYSGGGGGGYSASLSGRGQLGGSAADITVDVSTEQLFVNGSGTYGSGGSGHKYTNNPENCGGNGGDGNYGGGVVLLYVGGDLLIDGTIKCDGLPGTDGADGYAGGGGGGGAGGGAIYIAHNLENPTITGGLEVLAGSPGNFGDATGGNGKDGTAGSPGTDGTVTVKQYVKGMTA